ncbi:hypothetical protein C4D60_Mb03t12640 [Musa balbisiana]|uniref:Cation-transporting P-type ATPase N-terminal domain-containing protein n=1 Tax=Musa balbisiana TaxID=52838 RepID=A0A4S8J9I8_MUSBA|nr:hypothetical protein C4D60_Mb03t12640 [Musa balbisiana]
MSSAISLEEIKNDAVDLEHIPVGEVFEQLKCDRNGLTNVEGENRIKIFGLNKLEEKKESKVLKFLGFMWNPLSWVMESAAIMAIALANGGVRLPRLPFLLLLSLCRRPLWGTIIGECNRGSLRTGKTSSASSPFSSSTPPSASSRRTTPAMPPPLSWLALHPRPRSAPRSFPACVNLLLSPLMICWWCCWLKVLRDGRWSEQDAAILVPGDIISIKLGDIIPADARLLDGDPLKIDQSALTGESLPVTRNPGDEVFSGSTCKQGEIEAVVIATGVHTFFGKAAHLVDSTNNVGHFQKARAGIDEVHFLPFNPVDKRTAITYVDSFGNWHRSSKGAPEQIVELCNMREDAKKKVHAVIDKFADRGLRSLAVARQEIPEKRKESAGGPWQFMGLLPLFDPPRHDSAETIRRALNLGVNVKMITGDQLAIAKETGRRLGMGTNMYPSSTLLGNKNDDLTGSLPVDELIEKADGFAGVFPEHKYEIVKRLQERSHICGMTGDGVNDAPALKKADIGIAVADATDAARGASDIVLTEPGLSVIVSAVLTSRAIFQRMKNYTIYAVSITIRVVLGFLLLALIWRFNFSPFMVLIIAILNDGTIMTISKDRVKPSPMPDSWKLREIFATGIVLGTYLALMTVLFFWIAHQTDFFPVSTLLELNDDDRHMVLVHVNSGLLLQKTFGVRPIRDNQDELTSAIYLQVSVVSQALIFVTRSRSWCFVERPGLLLVAAFVIAQLVATFISVYASWGFARILGIGWGWAGVIWLFSIVTFFPLDILKFIIRYTLSGKAWVNLYESKTAFTTKLDYGKGEREAQWALAQRTLHGLQPPDSSGLFNEKNYRELSEIAEQAKRRAEVAR